MYDKGVLISQDTTPETEFEWMISYRSGDMLAPKLETREALATETENIIQAILGKDQLIVDGPAGLRVVQILDAAQQSIDQHGARVPVPGQGLKIED